MSKTLKFADVCHGDSVTFRIHAGIGLKGPETKAATGRAIICCQADHGTIAINMGGRHGLPGVATADNFISARRASTRHAKKP